MAKETRERMERRMKLKDKLKRVLGNPWQRPVCSEGGPSLLDIYELMEDGTPPDHCEYCRKLYNLFLKIEGAEKNGTEEEKAECFKEIQDLIEEKYSA